MDRLKRTFVRNQAGAMTPETALAYAYKVAHVPPDWRDDVVQDAMLTICERAPVSPEGAVLWVADKEEVQSSVNRATYQRQVHRTRVDAPVASLDAILSGELSIRNLAKWLGRET